MKTIKSISQEKMIQENTSPCPVIIFLNLVCVKLAVNVIFKLERKEVVMLGPVHTSRFYRVEFNSTN